MTPAPARPAPSPPGPALLTSSMPASSKARCVVEGALRRRDLIISSDPGDLHAIAAASSSHLEIDHP